MEIIPVIWLCESFLEAMVTWQQQELCGQVFEWVPPTEET